jgi:hypothetical protein
MVEVQVGSGIMYSAEGRENMIDLNQESSSGAPLGMFLRKCSPKSSDLSLYVVSSSRFALLIDVVGVPSSKNLGPGLPGRAR